MTSSMELERNRPAFARPAPPEARARLKGRLGRLLLAAITVLVLALRLVELDRLPGELYGDIAIVYRYVQSILTGHWPSVFVLSTGPLYHYAIVPIVWLAGLSYFGLKVASVTVSLLLLVLLYALASELDGPELGLLSVFIAGVSSWLLIFSRLGNSQILVPLLTVATLLLALRAVRLGRRRETIACAVVSGLGMYTYPQTFILPPVIFLTLIFLPWTSPRIRHSRLLLFAGVTVLCAIPFAIIVARDTANFVSGYIGGKLETDSGSLRTLAANIQHALLAYHLRGDAVFRSNPGSRPHLDVVSGVLFLVGLVFWLRPERRRVSPLVLVPLVLLHAPSVLVLSNPEEVPSASRTLGVAPLAYLLVASGLWWLIVSLRSFPRIGAITLSVTLLLILGANTWRYFALYAEGLPNQNTPFGRIIAEYIDGLPPETHVYLVGCCWGDFGQPEPEGVKFVTRRPQDLTIVEVRDATCAWLQELPRPAVLIWSPGPSVPTTQMAACAGLLSREKHSSPSGAAVFHTASLDYDRANDKNAPE